MLGYQTMNTKGNVINRIDINQYEKSNICIYVIWVLVDITYKYMIILLFKQYPTIKFFSVKLKKNSKTIRLGT